MVSGHGNIETAVAAIKEGAYDFIEKPFQAERLLISVQRAIESARLKLENYQLKEQISSALIGKSSQMQNLRNAITKVAPKNSRVFISGGVGVGKETVAREIHFMSTRNASPFLVLNCAMMTPESFEQELFGSEDTTHGNHRVGLLEQAHGGTLYLEEITDMPIELQAKFARTLERKTFHRVNGRSEVTIDVRVIAGSSRNIQEALETKRLRSDLYFRLNVVPITVPSLSERKDDMALLCDYFLKKIAKACNVPLKRMSEDTIAALHAYNWPGNVRQLRNVIEWILIMHQNNDTEFITCNMLPPEVLGIERDKKGDHPKGYYDAEIMAMPLKEAREAFERDYLTQQISRFNNNISRASEFIGMDRSALHRKLRSLKLNDDQAGGNDKAGAA